ncbi:MAG: DNA/RNA non-specific endonuclease [Mogibacterium sp.]|nr:DNA/RNA non-specific endonuclease [Mogibacterium sp.]
MSRKSESRQPNNSKNNSNKSQRRLALAVLLIIFAASVFFSLSNIPWIAEYREQLLSELGIGSGEEPDTVDPGTIGTGSQGGTITFGNAKDDGKINDVAALDSSALPDYDGHHYVTVTNNVPEFDQDVYDRAGLVYDNGRWKTPGTVRGVNSKDLAPYEYYGELDELGRCTVAYGCLGLETMPERDRERGDISSVHPSGWAKAQSWERCHLIAWALSAENANDRNLITGTHYLNYDGMRPLEEEVEHYIWNTGNHVLYMAKPYFAGSELVARGVQMTAWSVEDEGKGVSFNVYCFNVTPGATIDYNSGIVTTAEQAGQEARLYVINKKSKVFHYPSCDGAKSMSKWNREEVTATRLELTSQGYTPCGYCEP